MPGPFTLKNSDGLHPDILSSGQHAGLDIFQCGQDKVSGIRMGYPDLRSGIALADLQICILTGNQHQISDIQHITAGFEILDDAASLLQVIVNEHISPLIFAPGSGYNQYFPPCKGLYCK